MPARLRRRLACGGAVWRSAQTYLEQQRLVDVVEVLNLDDALVVLGRLQQRLLVREQQAAGRFSALLDGDALVEQKFVRLVPRGAESVHAEERDGLLVQHVADLQRPVGAELALHQREERLGKRAPQVRRQPLVPSHEPPALVEQVGVEHARPGDRLGAEVCDEPPPALDLVHVLRDPGAAARGDPVHAEVVAQEGVERKAAGGDLAVDLEGILEVASALRVDAQHVAGSMSLLQPGGMWNPGRRRYRV
ncbi:glyoxalase [Babesia caballi]|uniref:Glyoxalase n=1 Tax=Babesia caballi TaxID=5871 RepID=A0AAV4LVA3_BABCB|nr:glyoxalase [Babesia caballi]